MSKKIIKFIIIVAVMMISMTGCGTRRQQQTETETVDNKIKSIDKMSELEENSFYVYKNKDKKYYPVYMKNCSFKVDEKNINTSQNDNRTLYFNDDWEKVPTLYEGDSLIYYTSENLNETFVIERFEDFGYSVGISNLERLES